MSSHSFESKFTPEPFSGCHLWVRATNNRGYGMVRLRGKMFLAHRLSWQLRNGEIPSGACVLHRCDTPLCVNPDHLFLGTMQNNMDDMRAKGRANWSGRATALTPELVREMRAMYKSRKFTQKEIGNKFGINRGTANDAITGLTWRDV